MSTPSERPEPWWQTNLGAGIIGGTISGVAVTVLLGAASQAAAALAAIPPWALWLIAVVAVVAALVAIPRTRRGLRQGAEAVWSALPVRRGRFEETKALLFDMTTRAVQSDQARKVAERDGAAAKTRFERSVDDLTDAVQRAQGERDSARRELVELNGEYSKLMTAAVEVQKKAAAKGEEDGRNAGIKLGRLLEKYGDDYTELSPAQKADRKQRAQHREAQLRGLEKTIADLQGRISADHDERVASLREQFEIGRRQGYDEAWKEVEAERGGDDGGAPLPEKAASTLRPPRWRVFHSSLDDPTDDEWTIHNPVKNSGITSLRLEVDRKLFSVYDAADWPVVDAEQEYFHFHGGVTQRGGKNGYAFTLVWETSDGRTEVEDIPPEPPPLYAGW